MVFASGVFVFYSVSLHSMRCLSRCPECIPLLRLCFFMFFFHCIRFYFSYVFQPPSFKTVLQCLRIYLRCRHTLEGKFFCRNIFEWKDFQPTPQQGELQNRSSLSLHQAWRLVLVQKSVRWLSPTKRPQVVISWIHHLCCTLTMTMTITFISYLI